GSWCCGPFFVRAAGATRTRASTRISERICPARKRKATSEPRKGPWVPALAQSAAVNVRRFSREPRTSAEPALVPGSGPNLWLLALIEKRRRVQPFERQLRGRTLADGQVQPQGSGLEDHGLQGQSALVDGVELAGHLFQAQLVRFLAIGQHRQAAAPNPRT